MNVLNRLILVLLFLALIVFSCVGIFVILFSRNALVGVTEPTLRSLSDPNANFTQLLCIGVLILVFAAAILFLYLELMPSGRQRMKLKSIKGVDVIVSVDAITTQLVYALDALPGVIRVVPHVHSGKGDAVDVMLDMTTTADVDVQSKTQQVMGATRQVLEDNLGLKVGKVQIRMDQMKLPKKDSVPPSAVVPALAASATQPTPLVVETRASGPDSSVKANE